MFNTIHAAARTLTPNLHTHTSATTPSVSSFTRSSLNTFQRLPRTPRNPASSKRDLTTWFLGGKPLLNTTPPKELEKYYKPHQAQKDADLFDPNNNVPIDTIYITGMHTMTTKADEFGLPHSAQRGVSPLWIYEEHVPHHNKKVNLLDEGKYTLAPTSTILGFLTTRESRNIEAMEKNVQMLGGFKIEHGPLTKAGCKERIEFAEKWARDNPRFDPRNDGKNCVSYVQDEITNLVDKGYLVPGSYEEQRAAYAQFKQAKAAEGLLHVLTYLKRANVVATSKEV